MQAVPPEEFRAGFTLRVQHGLVNVDELTRGCVLMYAAISSFVFFIFCQLPLRRIEGLIDT
jgi:hypothetical protein